MDYIEQLKAVSSTSKYTKWYCEIVNQAIKRADTRKKANKICGYTEKHHILPKSFGLGGNKDPKNYAFLTAREHFICHWLLTKMVSSSYKISMAFALRIIRNKKKYNTRITSRVFEKNRLIVNQHLSILRSGVRLSEEHKKKIGTTNKGKLKGRPNPTKGIARGPQSPEHIIKVKTNRKSIKGISLGKQPTATCPHCNKTGGQSGMTRYHFDNCKGSNCES